MSTRPVRRGLRRLAVPLLASVALLLPTVPASAAPAATSAECAPPAAPHVPGARVLSVTAQAKPAGVIESPWFPPIAYPALCEIKVTLTHPGVNDKVLVAAWLPRAGWNGRFQGVGGGGYSMGNFDFGLAMALRDGYAAATTDGGVGADGLDPASWALGPDGKVNEELLTNFSSRSLHDMAVVGKAVTAAHYGRPADYAYWNGCSTGGRQGLMNAQRYPGDYDGILAAAPAISMPRFLVADLWGQVVMRQEKVLPTNCEFEAFQQAAIKACDTLDGVADGVLEQPLRCRYDPASLIGQKILCEGKEITISRAVAEVVRKIWAGHPSWSALPKSAPFSVVADTQPGPDGKLVGVPNPIADNWVRYFVEENPKFTLDSVSYRDFNRIAAKSPAKLDRFIGSDNPDLSGFRRAGGKMITWHGWTDPIIFAQGTTDYRDRVERRMGGAAKVDEFYRVFLAPGVDHCGGGAGPAPVDPLGAVVKWVEQGKAPDTLPAATKDATGAQVTRNLCRYPQISHYDGKNDPKQAASYHCAR
ncbi:MULTISPECIES: tannase/feruloyl esterase family alpha/beta hydrolase [unclassified Crossiella]|uniref:tannase/feruloyl esterase family alpha/beta hydrolase n=1 Tax=unclassified Crossiella TaxID=2620835 RepID=UPI001FFEBFA0|nr:MULTISPECIES: tannase/feruloyl esterase family alpha/beta hydrolase [unclassified Crossiella]MCK2239820.1 tannase/feruloyl esterase family alpha/beta hydrolase [Crossiella sp. S99.2]MCK2252515.1 tannase/feruloyl esterase family alpha/beta hydrolase [Crossiella sp. S99.1]